MRGKRSKQYRKLMHQYALAFSFREPYQVLITADIILTASQHKMSLGKLLSSTLHGEIKPMITQCCIRHLYNLPASEPHRDACIEVAKAAERRRCGHHELEEPLSALECLESVVGNTNKNRYVVASQELEVRQRMREIPGVPLIYINRSVMILEPMAPNSEKVKEGEERAKIRAGLKSRRSVGEKRKREDEEEEEDEEEKMGGEVPEKKKFKAKGPKGPNPLSVKKSKKEQQLPPISRSQAIKTEDELSAIRRAVKADPQAAEKTLGGSIAATETVDGVTDGTRKRKRKRKPKEVSNADEEAVKADED